MLSRCFLDFSEGVLAFVIGLSQISSFLSKRFVLHIIFLLSYMVIGLGWYYP